MSDYSAATVDFSFVSELVSDCYCADNGRPRIVTDRQLTHEEISNYNLVLWGRPQTNMIIAEIACHLPLLLGDHQYGVGERIYRGPDLGLAMCYPNPLARNRYVVIFSGEFWGEHLSINHKFDLLPDYIIYDTSRQEYDDTDRHLCAGFFDNHWQLDESRQSRTDNVGAVATTAAYAVCRLEGPRRAKRDRPMVMVW